MDVAPHPHIGLQTVTWLHEGEVVHDDSLGSASILRPGGVNVMTSGAGIAHAEQTPREHTGRLNGVQLWTALPETDRHGSPGFAHVEEVPAIERPGGMARVFAGSLEGARVPAPYYSPLLGVDLRVHPRQRLEIPLDPAFEHAVLVMSGDCAFDGEPLADRVLHYLGTTRTDASFSSRDGARVLMIGGPPFPETILMWWNFVARTPEEIERDLMRVFENNGIKRIDPINEKFDANHHEVMFEVETPHQPPGTVVQVIDPGYMIHERLLRPARVGVAKAGGEAPPAQGGNVDQQV